MGKAGTVLKQVLEAYGISQNKLAVAMGIGRSSINRWVNENRDPGGDAILEIRKGLNKINPAAAEEFIGLYLDESFASGTIETMRKAGKSLRQVLEAYGISQNKLAIAMGIGRSTIHHWVNESRDSGGDAILEIRKGLNKLNPTAAEEFIRLYLDESDEDEN